MILKSVNTMDEEYMCEEVKSHQMYNINFIIEFSYFIEFTLKQFVGAPRGKFKFSENFLKLFPSVLRAECSQD